MRIDPSAQPVSSLTFSCLQVATPTILSHDYATCVAWQTTTDDGAGTSHCWSTVALLNFLCLRRIDAAQRLVMAKVVYRARPSFTVKRSAGRAGPEQGW